MFAPNSSTMNQHGCGVCDGLSSLRDAYASITVPFLSLPSSEAEDSKEKQQEEINVRLDAAAAFLSVHPEIGYLAEHTEPHLQALYNLQQAYVTWSGIFLAWIVNEKMCLATNKRALIRVVSGCVAAVTGWTYIGIFLCLALYHVLRW